MEPIYKIYPLPRCFIIGWKISVLAIPCVAGVLSNDLLNSVVFISEKEKRVFQRVRPSFAVFPGKYVNGQACYEMGSLRSTTTTSTKTPQNNDIIG